MDSRERVITAFRRQPPDRVPAVLYGELVGYVPAINELLEKNCGGKSTNDYFNFDITSFPIKPPEKEQGFSRYLQADENTTVDEWGVGWKRGSYLHYFSILHPLEGADFKTIEEYPFPDLDQEYRYEDAAEKVREIHEKRLAAAFFTGPCSAAGYSVEKHRCFF